MLQSSVLKVGLSKPVFVALVNVRRSIPQRKHAKGCPKLIDGDLPDDLSRSQVRPRFPCAALRDRRGRGTVN